MKLDSLVKRFNAVQIKIFSKSSEAILKSKTIFRKLHVHFKIQKSRCQAKNSHFQALQCVMDPEIIVEMH